MEIDDLDFLSNEALEASGTIVAEAEDNPEPDAEVEAEAPATEDKDTAQADKDSDNPDDDSSEGPQEDPDAEWEGVPDKLKGKSAQEIGKIYADTESFFSKREKELKEQLAQQAEQFQKMLETVREPAQPQAPQVDADALIDEVITNPNGAFEYAANHRPDLVPSVLAAISEQNPVLANRLQIEYNEYRFNELLQQQQAPIIQQQQQLQSERDAAATYSKFVNEHKDVSDIQEEWATAMQENEWMLVDKSAEGMTRFMKACYLIAKAGALPRLAERQEEQIRNSTKQKKAAFVEASGGGTVPTSETPDEASQIVADLLATQSGLY